MIEVTIKKMIPDQKGVIYYWCPVVKNGEVLIFPPRYKQVKIKSVCTHPVLNEYKYALATPGIYTVYESAPRSVLCPPNYKIVIRRDGQVKKIKNSLEFLMFSDALEFFLKG